MRCRWAILTLLAGSVALAAQDPSKKPGTTRPRLVVRNRALHQIDSRLFGTFLSIAYADYETGFESAILPGTHRLQPKVVDMLRQLSATIIRFPDGDNLDAINWTDMVDNVPGRAGGRPVVAPRGDKGEKITNAFGYDEFLRLCEDIKAEPLLIVNIRKALLEKGTLARSARDTAALVAYCNARPGAKLPNGLDKWRDLRIQNGRREPYKVRYLEIGNEPYFYLPELKKRYPNDYLRRYLDCLKTFVREVKAVDPTVQFLTASIGGQDDVAIRREFGNQISFLIEHYYLPVDMNGFSQADKPVATAKISQRAMWNAYVAAGAIDPDTGLSIVPFQSVVEHRDHGYPVAVTEWNWMGYWTAAPSAAPEPLPLAWGVGAAGMLHGMMRAGPVVKIACQSLAIGKSWTITAIRVDPAGKAEPYFMPTGQVVALYARRHGETLLETIATNVPTFDQPLRFGYTDPSPKVASLDALATSSPRAVFLHLINRDFDRSIDLDVDLSDFKNLAGTGTRHALAGRLKEQPAAGESRQVAHVEQSAVRLDGTTLRLKLPARTVTCVELETRQGSSAGADKLQKDSVWISDSPNRTFTVLERKGDTFRARFTHATFDRELAGTIKGGKISWLAKDVKPFRGGRGGDNEGTVKEDTIDLVWTDGKGGTGEYSLRLKKGQ